MKLSHAAIVSPGTTKINKTGGWRTFVPVFNHEVCNKCGICKTFCPEGIVFIVSEKYAADLDYCKGCGICANECPKNGIVMVLEAK